MLSLYSGQFEIVAIKNHYYLQEPIVTFEEAQKVCHARVLLPKDFTCIQLVVGAAGEKSVRIFSLDFL